MSVPFFTVDCRIWGVHYPPDSNVKLKLTMCEEVVMQIDSQWFTGRMTLRIVRSRCKAHAYQKLRFCKARNWKFVISSTSTTLTTRWCTFFFYVKFGRRPRYQNVTDYSIITGFLQVNYGNLTFSWPSLTLAYHIMELVASPFLDADEELSTLWQIVCENLFTNRKPSAPSLLTAVSSILVFLTPNVSCHNWQSHLWPRKDANETWHPHVIAFLLHDGLK